MASILNVLLRITGQNALGGSLTGLNQGLELAQQAVQALDQTFGAFARRGVAFNASMETTTLQFKTLMGSADEAQKHVADLFKLGAETPFETQQIIEASRNLRVMGGAALDTRDNLELVGDAAAATGANIQEVAFWTGRAYSAIQAGRPFGEAAQRLQELGILSAETRNKLEDLQAAGASNAEIWRTLGGELGRFTGAMKEQAQTWQGLTSTMQDSLDVLAGEVTHQAFVRLEGDLQRVNTQLQSAEAQRSAQGLGMVVDAILAQAEREAEHVAGLLGGVGTNVAQISDLVAARGEIMADVLGGDLPAAFGALREALYPTLPALEDVTDAFSRHADAARTASAAIEAAIPLHKQMRDTWADEAYAADNAALAVGGYRDESYRAAGAQAILNEQLRRARLLQAEGAEDLFTRHPELNMPVLTGGDLSGIDAILKRQQEAARAQEQAEREKERAAREAARAQEQAARAAAHANTTAAHTTETAWSGAHASVAAGATHTAAVQVTAAQAAAQAVVDSTQAMRDALQQSYGNPSGGLFPSLGNALRPAGFSPTGGPVGRVPFVQPVVVQFNGNVTTTQADFNSQVAAAVNTGLRSGSIQVAGR